MDTTATSLEDRDTAKLQGDAGSDRQLAAWIAYNLNSIRYRETRNSDHLARKNAALLEIFELFQEGILDRAMFTEFTDDAVGGGFSDIHSVDNNLDYSQANLRPTFIKRMPIDAARQAFRDSRYAREHFTREQFFLAPALDIAEYPQQGFALYVTTLIPGPNIAEIFRVLNARIDQGIEVAAKIKGAILDKNLEDLILWQRQFKATLDPEILEVQTQPQTIVDRYKSNTEQAVANAERLMYARAYFDLIISDIERRLFGLGLELYGKLHLTPERTARIRDDTETNSGLAMGRIRYASDSHLYDALVDSITKKSDNGKVNGDAVAVVANGAVISYDRIAALYSHWDTATGSFGHFLEDFWRIVDSFSLRLPDYVKTTEYRAFLAEKFGTEMAESHDDGLDSQLVRFFRNFRHRDIVASVFARNNEERFNIGAKTEDERDEKRVNYLFKAAHYLQMSALALDNTIKGYNVGGSEAERLTREFDHAMKLLKLVENSSESQLELQGRLDGPVKGITRLVEHAGNAAVRELGQLYGLRYLVEKMRLYHKIHFDRLV